jgi:hypothetical protein
MAPIAGTYRMVTSDNLTAECEATFSAFLSPADLKLIAAPGNVWTLVIRHEIRCTLCPHTDYPLVFSVSKRVD